jgi:putative glutamine amidotransferase
MKRPRIGLSACFFHGDPTRPIFKGKTLLYLEESLAHWIQSEGALVYLLPTVPSKVSGEGLAVSCAKPRDPDLPLATRHSPLTTSEVISDIDGLVLQGGSDVAPETYGETSLRPEWAGDAIRDKYEIELVKECLQQRKPILGVCRGAQLLNVALAGTLYQDISAQLPGARIHRDWEIYDRLFHDIRIHEGSALQKLYPGKKSARVNSVHHQGIKDLGKGLRVEASALDDGMVEAIRFEGQPFAFGFQWHPEFQDPLDPTLLDCKPILRHFLQEACRTLLG